MGPTLEGKKAKKMCLNLLQPNRRTGFNSSENLDPDTSFFKTGSASVTPSPSIGSIKGVSDSKWVLWCQIRECLRGDIEHSSEIECKKNKDKLPVGAK